MAEDFLIGVDHNNDSSNFQQQLNGGFSSLREKQPEHDEMDNDMVYRRPDDLINDEQPAQLNDDRKLLLGRSPTPADGTHRAHKRQNHARTEQQFFNHAEGRAKIHIDHGRKGTRQLNGDAIDDGNYRQEGPFNGTSKEEPCNLGFANTFDLGFRNQSQDTIQLSQPAAVFAAPEAS